MDKRVPEVRFKGFTDDWEQRKLGDVANIVRGASPRPIKNPKWFDNESDIGWLRISDVTEQNGRIHYLDQHISKIGQAKTRIITKKHLLLSIAATVGKPVINYIKTGVHDGFLIFLNPRFDIEFMFQWLEMFRPNWDKYGQPGSQVNLNSDIVKKQEVFLPNKNEQKEIGKLLDQIDKLYDLQQEQFRLYRELRKGLLQRLFPSNDENSPSIRFISFKSNWKKYTLSDISQRVTAKNKDNLFSDTLTNSAEYGIIDQFDFFDKSISNKKNLNGYYIVKENDFVYNPRISNQAPVGPINRNKLGKTGIISPLYYVFRTHKINNGYLEYYFNTNKWYKFMKLNGDSGVRSDRFSIKNSVFETMQIPCPNISEQIKINRLLIRVDNTCRMEKIKLEYLQTLKKYFLKKLFI